MSLVPAVPSAFPSRQAAFNVQAANDFGGLEGESRADAAEEWAL